MVTRLVHLTRYLIVIEFGIGIEIGSCMAYLVSLFDSDFDTDTDLEHKVSIR